MYSRFQSLSLILDTHRQQACYIRKGQIIQFSTFKDIQTAFPVQLKLLTQVTSVDRKT